MNLLVPSDLEILLLIVTPALPLIFAAFCLLPRLRPVMADLLPAATVPAAITALIVPQDLAVEVPWFFMGGAVGLTTVSAVFLGSSAIIWFFSAASFSRLAARSQHNLQLYICFLLAMSGNFGLIVAREMLGFYLFYALMSFSVYGLIVHDRKSKSFRAGQIYIIVVMISEVAFFTALVLLYKTSGSFSLNELAATPASLLVVILLYIGLGAKAGVLPLHVWMPSTYNAAPPPAAAALAGAMVNAGVLGWLTFLLPLRILSPGIALLFIIAGGIAAFGGVLWGLARTSPGAVLGCSSISQMGLMTVMVGAGLINPDLKNSATAAVTLFAVHHGLCKSSLFLGIRGQKSAAQSKNLFSFLLLLLPALSLAGLPFTSGAAVKSLVKALFVDFADPWKLTASWLFSASSLATTVLVLHFVNLARSTDGTDEQNLSTRGMWVASALAAILLPWIWPEMLAVSTRQLSLHSLWAAAWPVACGWLAFKIYNGSETQKKLAAFLFGSIPGFYDDSPPPFKSQGKNFLQHILDIDLRLMHYTWLKWSHARIGQRLLKSEKVLGRWAVAGFSYLVLIILLFVFI